MRSDYELDVYWNDRKVGLIRPADMGKLIFSYDDEWISSSASPISLSLPTSAKEHSPSASTTFFANLLPEGSQYDALCLKAGIASGDIYSFLEEYGLECAGALVLRHEWDSPQQNSSYRDITEDLEILLSKRSGSTGNLIASTGSRLSLAGAQNKLPVYWKDGRFLVPSNGSTAPTDAILKPPSPFFDELPQNEYFCMRLASSAGLVVPESKLVRIGKSTAFIVRRFDRPMIGGRIARKHQEDFCQALGVDRLRKYELDGGPGFSECGDLLLRREMRDGIAGRQSMIRCMLFNYLIGNCDAHAKNFSILHDEDGVRLAPFYDLVSTMAYSHLDSRFAMRIGNSADYSEIDSSAWTSFAKKLRVRPSTVFNIMSEVHDAVSASSGTLLEEMCDTYGHSRTCYDIQLTIRTGLASFERCLSSKAKVS